MRAAQYFDLGNVVNAENAADGPTDVHTVEVYPDRRIGAAFKKAAGLADAANEDRREIAGAEKTLVPYEIGCVAGDSGNIGEFESLDFRVVEHGNRNRDVLQRPFTSLRGDDDLFDIGIGIDCA